MIIPTQFESRHEVMASAREANTIAKSRPGSNIYVADTDQHEGNLAA